MQTISCTRRQVVPILARTQPPMTTGCIFTAFYHTMVVATVDTTACALCLVRALDLCVCLRFTNTIPCACWDTTNATGSSMQVYAWVAHLLFILQQQQQRV